MSNKNNSSLIVVAVFITSFLTAIVNVFIVNVYQANFMAVVPIGAILIGTGGASGGLLVCRLLNIRPKKRDGIFFVFVTLTTIWLIYYLSYFQALSSDGRSINETTAFFDYFKTAITTEHIGTGKGENRSDYGEIGGFGYVILLIRFFEVMLGGFLVFSTLGSMPICQKCEKYLHKIGSKFTKEMTKEVATRADEQLKLTTIDKYKAALIDLQGCPPYSEFDIVKFKLTLYRCPNCKYELVTKEVLEIQANEWEVIGELATETSIPQGETIASEFQKL